MEKADSQKLSALGIQGHQIKNETGTKVEFETVYSAIVLNYLEKQTIIPFVLSTATLEYDLAQRLQQIVSGQERRALILAGNGRSLSENYRFVRPWLSSRGFVAEECELESAAQKIRSLNPNDSLVVLGSSQIDFETAEEIDRALSRNVGVFVATSPYTVPIEDAWDISHTQNDAILPILEERGIEFGDSLVCDISCVPITMQSGEGETAELQTENYPLWLSILPQESAPRGITLFWASPLILDKNAKSSIQTSDFSWTVEESGVDGREFQTDVFVLPKTANAADAVAETQTVGAQNENLFVISDQYFLDSMMMGFISGENGIADLRNFDFLCACLLRLRGDGELAILMEKSRPSTALYKLSGDDFFAARFATIVFHFAILPIFFVLAFIFVFIWRRKNHESKESK